MKKKTGLRLLVLLIAAALLACALSGCKGKDAEIVLKIGETGISEQVYRFWLGEIKNSFVSNYSDVTDTLECWNRKTTDVEGNTVTWAEYVEQYVLLYAKNVAVELKLFEDYGLGLTDEEKDKIESYINELIYYRYGDSKSAFNEALRKTYGITIDDLRDAMTAGSKAARLEDYLLGENGKLKPTDAEIEDYFQKHYVRIQVLLIYTDAEYQLGEDGKIAYDEAGQPIVKRYTDEEKELKRKKADAVYAMAQEDGADFGELVGTYGELIGNAHPDGFYFSDEDILTLASAKGYDLSILREILKQQTGSVARYETEGEAIFIVKKLEPVPEVYKLSSEEDQFTALSDRVNTAKMRSLIEPMLESVSVDESVYGMKIVDVKKGLGIM